MTKQIPIISGIQEIFVYRHRKMGKCGREKGGNIWVVKKLEYP